MYLRSDWVNFFLYFFLGQRGKKQDTRNNSPKKETPKASSQKNQNKTQLPRANSQRKPGPRAQPQTRTLSPTNGQSNNNPQVSIPPSKKQAENHHDWIILTGPVTVHFRA